MIFYVKIFCLIWVVYSLQYQLRGMKYELSRKWFLNTLEGVVDCWYCFAFWTSLIVLQDVYLAACLSFSAYILEKIFNKLET